MSESEHGTNHVNHGPTDPADLDIPPELAAACQTIDSIDAVLVHILVERFRCTQRVSHIKALNELPPADPAREARRVARLRALAKQSGFDPGFAQKFLTFMITKVIHHHEDIKAEYESSE